MPKPFDGVRVLDFTQGMPGAVTTMVMADYGADVIKIERPGGDPFRVMPASCQWDRGKRSVVVDLKTDQGRRNVAKFARNADVVVESFRPGVSERLGIDRVTLEKDRSDLIYCSITGWGPKGPYARYKAYDAMVQAKSGRMLFYAGQTRREGPHYSAVAVASHAASMAALRGVTAALMVREVTGQGQTVETSLLQGLSYYDWIQWMTWQMMERDPEHYPSDNLLDLGRTPAMAYVPARTKDGQWIQLANHMVRLFNIQMQTIGLGHLLEEPRFKGLPRISGAPQNEMWRLILARMSEKTLDEWMDTFTNKVPDVAAEPYFTAPEGMSHPQILHNGNVAQVDDPEHGLTRQLGLLFSMSRTPGDIQGPAPRIGEHTTDVVAEASSLEARPVSKTGPLPRTPLEDVLVLDFTTVIAGPLAGSLLAELGARVIRIEALGGDHIRHLTYGGIGANRTMAGTEGFCVDLKSVKGREIVHALVKKADVLMHNMRPGAPNRIGISYEQVRSLNPKIIYQYIAGYGSTGPHSKRPAMYPIGGCISGGALGQLGQGLPPPPEQDMTMEEVMEVSRMIGRAQEVNPDLTTGMVAATSVVMGLYTRSRFGIAQYLEPTLIGASAYACVDDFYDYPGRHPRPLADPEGYGLHALYRLYRAYESWLFLACPMPGDWEGLCAALGREDLAEDARFADADARCKNDKELAAELGSIFASKNAQDWEQELSALDVGCVQAEERSMYHFALEDPQVKANHFTTELDHIRFGRYWRHSPGISMSETPCIVGPGPLKGQHTAPILRELGYSEADIKELKAEDVIDWEDP